LNIKASELRKLWSGWWESNPRY